MLMLKLTQYGTTLQIIINFEDIESLVEREDGSTLIGMRFGTKYYVNESIDTISETVMGYLSGNNSFRSN